MKINKEFEVLHLDKDELFVWNDYRGGSPYDYHDLTYGNMKRYNSFYDDDKELWYMPTIMSGSDHSGDVVTRSNFLAMQKYAKRSKSVKEVYGGYNTYAMAFNISRLKGKFALELVDLFKRLQDYPLVDEDKMGELESELEGEAWSNWLGRDFESELRGWLKSIGIEVDEIADSNPNAPTDPSDPDYYLPQDLWSIYRELMDVTNTYPTYETGCSVHVELEDLFKNRDKVVKVIGNEKILRWLLVFDNEDQIQEAFTRLFRKDETYPITLAALTRKWGSIKEIDETLELFDKIFDEWDRLSFDDKEALATIGIHVSNRDKYFYLYSALKEMEK